MQTINEIKNIINYFENEVACESVSLKGNFPETIITITREGIITITDEGGNNITVQNLVCKADKDMPISYLYFIQTIEVNAGFRKKVDQSIETRMTNAVIKKANKMAA